MSINWAWLLIGVALGWFVVPMVTGMLARKKAPAPAA